MLADALEHLVRGIVDHPDDVTRARQAAAPRFDARGPGAPRRPRQGDRPQRSHRHGVPHRRLGARRAAAARASTSSTSTAAADSRGSLALCGDREAHHVRDSPPRRGTCSTTLYPGDRGRDRGRRRPDRQAARAARRGHRRRAHRRARAALRAGGRSCAARPPAGSRQHAARRSPSGPPAGTRTTLLVDLRGDRGPRRRRGRPRHRARPPTLDPRRVPEDPDEFYDHQLVGLAAYDEAGVAAGRGGRRACTAAPRTC